jgi:hypothetical protein
MKSKKPKKILNKRVGKKVGKNGFSKPLQP